MNDEEKAQKEQRKQGIAGLFGRAAPTYDSVGPRFFSQFGRRLVELAQLHPGASVLDVATGRGAVLFPAAQQVGSQGHVMGIDLAEGMVKETAEAARQQGQQNVEVRQMDGENLAFEDGVFDVVFCGFGIFFFPELDRALSGFKRILKPGGQIAVTTWGRDDERWSWLGELGKKYMQHMPPPIQAWMAAQAVRAPQAPVFNTPDGLQTILSSAGFTNIRVTAEEVEVTYADEQEWLAVEMSHGRRFVYEALPETIVEQYKADAFEHLRAIKRSDGIPHALDVLYTLAEKPSA
jgi:ubiquinone/menaquinone biosynthesis C-methylase UbiE